MQVGKLEAEKGHILRHVQEMQRMELSREHELVQLEVSGGLCACCLHPSCLHPSCLSPATAWAEAGPCACTASAGQLIEIIVAIIIGLHCQTRAFQVLEVWDFAAAPASC